MLDTEDLEELIKKLEKLKNENRRLKQRVSSLEANLFRVMNELDKYKKG